MKKDSKESDSDVSSFHSNESYETIDSDSYDSEYDSDSYDSEYDSESYESRFECPHNTDDECTCSFPSDYSRWSRSSSLRDHSDSIFKNLKLTEKDGMPYYLKYHMEKTGTKRIKKKWKSVYKKWVSIHSKTLETNKYDVAINLIKKLMEIYKKNQYDDNIRNLYKIGSRLIKFTNYHKKRI